MVAARGICFGYRGGWRLGPVDLDLSGGVTALVGPNGAGKTTLIRILAGQTRAQEGELAVDGVVIRSGRAVDEYRRRVGYLPQDARWAGGWRARDLVDFAAQSFGIARRATPAARQRALAMAGAAEFEERRLGSLSGGQRQRVHLAVALDHDPDILILDEPTAGLDPAERIRIRNVLSPNPPIVAAASGTRWVRWQDGYAKAYRVVR